MLGIGTITYYDPENNSYGALGHKMSDSNSEERLVKGNVYSSSVKKIQKSINGNPGEKIASINKDELIGNIEKNNTYGIYGEYVNVVKDELIETASIDEVKEGKAYIYTVVDDNKIDKFEIEITKAKRQDTKDVKGITFKITDKRLLVRKIYVTANDVINEIKALSARQQYRNILISTVLLILVIVAMEMHLRKYCVHGAKNKD